MRSFDAFRVIVFLVFASLTGCASPVATLHALERFSPSVSFRVDTARDDHDLAASDFGIEFVLGAEAWGVVGARLVLDDEAPRVLRCATWDMGIALATTNSAGIAVKCLALFGLSYERRIHVMAHELGHVFGLDHVSAEQAIMFSVEGASTTTLQPADLEEWARRVGDGG